jgi:hypothetical protein
MLRSLLRYDDGGLDGFRRGRGSRGRAASSAPITPLRIKGEERLPCTGARLALEIRYQTGLLSDAPRGHINWLAHLLFD